MNSNTEPLPFGSGSKLNQEAEKLPALKVDNEVYWVNPNFPNFPGKLIVGQPSEFAFQLIPFETVGNEGNIEVSLPNHKRSGILGRLIFEDNQGNKYRDLDAKGIGAIIPKFECSSVPFEQEGKESAPIGLEDLPCAKHDVWIEEKLRQIGVRTCPTVAIILLKELVDRRGLKISIEEAKEKGIIKPERIPVVSLRAFVTKTRLIDLADSNKDTTLLWQDTLLLVRQETGREMTKESYCYWLARNLGEQIGKMHFAGFRHNYLSLHNITADGRIVDYDSVEENQTDFQKDRDDALLTLDKLVSRDPKFYEQNIDMITKTFLANYHTHFHLRRNQVAAGQA